MEAIVTELDQEIRKNLGEENETKVKQLETNKQNIRVMLFLAVAYAASCGGVGTLTGTGPNLVFKGMIATTFGSGTPINFASWMVDFKVYNNKIFILFTNRHLLFPQLSPTSSSAGSGSRSTSSASPGRILQSMLDLPR